MTERELQFYEALESVMGLVRYEARWPSGKERLEGLEALLAGMPDLKAESARRHEAAMEAAGWVREGQWRVKRAA